MESGFELAMNYFPDPSLLADDDGSIDHETLDAEVVTSTVTSVPLLRLQKKKRRFIDADGKVDPEWESVLVDYVLGNVITVGGFPLLPKLKDREACVDELDRIVKEHPDIVKWTYQAMCDKTFRVLRLLVILRPMPATAYRAAARYRYTNSIVDPDPVTVNAWKFPFRGNSASLLHEILTSYSNLEGSPEPYVRFVPHVQSSGTGKSRVHDELAKHVVYIPICLASKPGGIYPPPDRVARDWIYESIGHPSSGDSDAMYTRKRHHGFLYALLTMTREFLENIQSDPQRIPPQRISDTGTLSAEKLPMGAVERDTPAVKATLFRLSRLASAFREKMNTGGSSTWYGEYRHMFYTKVCEMASKFVKHSQATHAAGSLTEIYTIRQGDGVKGAASRLREFLDPDNACQRHLLSVLCVDEARQLTERIPWEEWTLFSELRDPLRQLREEPFFTVFLSTAGDFPLISPNPTPTSSRFPSGLNTFNPITEVGFDQFSEKVVVGDSQWTLDRIASTQHIAHLGRALFATRYDCGGLDTRRSIVRFALTKLLCGRPERGRPDDDMKLACLAVRLGLDFKTVNWEQQEVERTQASRHMRLYLSATPGFQRVTTISPSEPLLAEAAQLAMFQSDWAPSALLKQIESSYVNPGAHGEVLAALILLLARDIAAENTAVRTCFERNTDLDNDGTTKRRVVAVVEFLDALLKDKRVFASSPSEYIDDTARDTPLGQAFQDGYIWFNHFVKVDDSGVINTVYLAGLIARGAAAIYSNNQRGVDVLIPILFGHILDPRNISAILIQARNDNSYSTDIKSWAFDSMDPFSIGLYSSTSRNVAKPVIRMVFALASPEPAIAVGSAGYSSERLDADQGAFIAYDIWCAGLFPDTFGVVRPTEVATYGSLLLRSRSSIDLYEPRGQDASVAEARINARRQMYPAVGTEGPHFESYVEF
ncbi:hypothetical protein OF83DRAFT_1178803 [Amylostereum chailletii]|nr:hypothetical protein OF83DRAFT_1178803 [Amylostereum chailletii]